MIMGAQQSRAEEIKTQRRRRGGFQRMGGKLNVDESKLDREKYAYRWVNDVPGRVQNLTVNDDWELVSDRDGEIKEDGNSLGASQSVHVGTDEKGHGLNAVLLRKPKQYYDEDAGAAQAQIDAQEKGLAEGIVPGGEADGGTTYVPEGGIQIQSSSEAS